MHRAWVSPPADIPTETKGYLFILTIFVVFCTVSVIVQFTPTWTDHVVKSPNHKIAEMSARIDQQQKEIDDLVSQTSSEKSDIKLSTTGTQPSCSAANRGQMWLIYGAPGTADVLQICQQTVSGFSWVAH